MKTEKKQSEKKKPHQNINELQITLKKYNKLCYGYASHQNEVLKSLPTSVCILQYALMAFVIINK